jgi:hypothetical protein
MFLSNANLADRVVNRFLRSRSEIDPHDHAIAWRLPAPFPDIPDDLIVQHSDGCTVTVQEVESAISKTRSITWGSCRFSQVHADDGTNRVRFRVLDGNGKLRGGTVTVNIVVLEDQLTAFSLIELDGEGSLASNPV